MIAEGTWLAKPKASCMHHDQKGSPRLGGHLRTELGAVRVDPVEERVHGEARPGRRGPPSSGRAPSRSRSSGSGAPDRRAQGVARTRGRSPSGRRASGATRKPVIETTICQSPVAESPRAWKRMRREDESGRDLGQVQRPIGSDALQQIRFPRPDRSAGDAVRTALIPVSLRRLVGLAASRSCNLWFPGLVLRSGAQGPMTQDRFVHALWLGLAVVTSVILLSGCSGGGNGGGARAVAADHSRRCV